MVVAGKEVVAGKYSWDLEGVDSMQLQVGQCRRLQMNSPLG